STRFIPEIPHERGELGRAAGRGRGEPPESCSNQAPTGSPAPTPRAWASRRRAVSAGLSRKPRISDLHKSAVFSPENDCLAGINPGFSGAFRTKGHEYRFLPHQAAAALHL